MLGAYIFTIVISSWIDLLIIMQCPSLSLLIVFILKSILSDNEYCHSSFLLIYIFMDTFFPSPHFQSVCVPRSEVGLLQTAYIWVCFCIHSASLCLLVGAFNPFTLKIIIDMKVLIAILLIVLDLFLKSFSSLPLLSSFFLSFFPQVCALCFFHFVLFLGTKDFFLMSLA